uniref:BED-type domain-containing protein n=1 Tax=Lactuca sativa TaxID=4236 RepID=A0A9R1V7T7_LACSA|nr:hypothetical protein LSAT_V11C600329940 [Lactuca sativa]
MMKTFWLITLKLTIKTEKIKQQRRKIYAKRAACWTDCEELEVDNLQHSKCKWCDTLLKIESSENGTSSMIRHSKRCKKNPRKLEENLKKQITLNYTNALNGKVVLPCRTTISKRVDDYYLEEKEKLNKFFSNPVTNVHLTIDFWTKIGRTLLTCLEEWGINNVMTITIDNVISNDKAIEFLMKKLLNLYHGGIQLHVRCMAHILNLIVKDGFDEHQSSIKCMKMAVRYIRKSTQRIQSWRRFLESLKLKDPTYVRDVVSPVEEHFKICRAMVGFLEKFKKYAMCTNTLGIGCQLPNFA